MRRLGIPNAASRLRSVRPKKLAIAAVGLLLAAGVLTGGLLKLAPETGVDSFLPSEDESVANLRELAGSFGGDPVVVLLESKGDRQLLNKDNIEKVVRLEGKLSSVSDVAAVYGPGTILNQIAGQTQKLLAELTGRRDAERERAKASAAERGASEAEAKAAGDAAVRDFDRRYGSLLVQGMPAGLPTLSNPGFVGKVVYNNDGQPRPQWRFVAPSADSIAILVRPREGIKAAATKELVDSVRAAVADSGLRTEKTTVSGVPAVASGLGEQVAREIPLLGGIAVVAVSACFLLTPWARRSRRLAPVLTTLVAIGFTLAVFGWLERPVSLGVLAFLPVLLGIGAYYPTYFAQRARKRTVLTVAAATSASFAALTLSPLPFVRDLGLALSVGVLCSALVGMGVSGWLSGSPSPGDGRRFDWPPGRRTTRNGVILVLVASAVAGWALLPGLPLQSNFQKFASGLPAMADAQHVQSEMGSSGELDIVLRGKNVRTVDAFDWMRRAQTRVVAEHGDELRPVVSPTSMLSFLGGSPTGEQLSAALRLLPPYLTESVIRSDGKVAVLSFGVQLDDVGALQRLRDSINDSLPPAPRGYRAELAGLPVVAVRGQELVSQDRVLANVAGIAAAGLVLALGLRRRSDAVRAVLAGATATGLGFCLLWLTGTALSPVSVALGSLTTAIGCEFTVLFAESVRQRSRRLLRSVLLATATSAVGYAVLAVSQLAVIREFGMLLAGSVILALVSAGCVVAASVRPEVSSSGAGEPAPARKSMAGVT